MAGMVSAAAFILIVFFGYSFIQGQRERVIVKRLEKMRDPNAVEAMMNEEIRQVKNEGETFEWLNRYKRLY